MTHESPFYRIRLGAGATQRGERVLCELLDWVGDAGTLAQVRIRHSTIPAYPAGRVGVVRRERLLPLRAHSAAS